jgi:hypothetical protein
MCAIVGRVDRSATSGHYGSAPASEPCPIRRAVSETWHGAMMGAARRKPDSKLEGDCVSDDDPRELEAKIAFDQSLAVLTGQRTDLQELQSKARDVAGVQALSTVFVFAFGAFGHGSVLDQFKHHPEWLYVLFGFPVLGVVFALFVIAPSGRWMFYIDAESMRTAMLNRPASEAFATPERLYLAYVDVLSPCQHQKAAALKRRKYALWLALLFLIVTIVLIASFVVSDTLTQASK